MTSDYMNQEEIQEQGFINKNVDDELNLLEIFKILKRRWLPFSVAFSSILIATGVLTNLQTPIYESKGQILISKTNEASELTGLAEQLNADPLSTHSNPLETEIQVLRSIPILEKVIQDLDLRDSESLPLKVSAFREKLQASVVGGTDVLEISYQDENSPLAADVVNAVMQVYLKNDIEVNRAQTRAAREFISQQIPRAEAQLSQAEGSLKDFKEAYGVVELTGEAQESVVRLGDLKASIVNTEALLLAAKERSRQLQKNFGGLKPDKAITLGKLSESRSVQSTITAAKELEDKLAIAKTTLQPNHPAISDLESQVREINSKLDSRIRDTAGPVTVENKANLELGENVGLELMTELVKVDIETKSMEEKLASLRKEFQTSVSRTEKLPALEQKQSELLRDLEVARQSYSTLLESYQKAQLAENQNLGNARVINQAQIMDKPIAPRKLLNMLTGAVLGLIGGAGLSLLLDARDIRVRTVKDIRDLLPYTLLGTIPIFSKPGKDTEQKTSLHVRDQPQSMVSETYRMINTNLRFSKSDELQVMVVSSSVPGEGKSTTIANLAIGMAELGARVLVIDGDLRRPVQHQMWEIPNRVGFSNMLVADAPMTSLPIIEEQANLHLLPAGALPPNPTALIDSQKCKVFFQDLRKEYDYIFIDAPPLTVASDAILLGKLSDGLILISRPEVVSKPAIIAAKNVLFQAKQTVLGLIINGVNVKNESTSYYYYSKSYYGSTDSGTQTSTTSDSRQLEKESVKS